MADASGRQFAHGSSQTKLPLRQRLEEASSSSPFADVKWKFDTDHCRRLQSRIDLNGARVSAHNPIGNCQSKTASIDRRRLAGVGAEESVENARENFGCNS